MSSVAAPAAPKIATTIWKIDPVHSVAEFKVRHMMISNVKGQFSGLSGVLTLNEADATKSHVQAAVDAATLSTRDPQRDAHLRSAHFFDAEKFPDLSFESTSVGRKSDGELTVAGKLSIHGTTREVVFAAEGLGSPVKDPWGNTRLGLFASTKINRKDFGLVWNATLETGGILVGDEVTISLDIQFVKA